MAEDSRTCETLALGITFDRIREIVTAVGLARDDDTWRACCWDIMTALRLHEKGDPDFLKHVGRP